MHTKASNLSVNSILAEACGSKRAASENDDYAHTNMAQDQHEVGE